LIELLVVISIILLASSIIFIGGSGGDGAKLSSAQRVVSGIAQGARGQAILKGAEARLIIYSDSTTNEEIDKRLRYFGIIYEDEENPGNWFAATQGTYLPAGVYYNPDLGRDTPSGNTMRLEYPRASAQSEGGGDEFYYYTFEPNGTVASEFQNTWLALQAGTLRPDTGVVDFSESQNEALKTALILRKAGTTTVVTDPTQIN
jgi:type II secretory pathway pseudopilin PulG